MKLSRRVLGLAALAALLWLGIGLIQRTRGGAGLTDAALAELPSTLVVGLISVLWFSLSERRKRP